MELLNFVGGEFVPADAKKSYVKLSPFDGSKLADVTLSEAMDVIKALQIAKKAMPLFSALSVAERAQLLKKIADYLEQNAPSIAYSEALYQGLPQAFVLKNSVLVSIQILRMCAQELLQELPARVFVKPSGIVGIITPWGCSLRLVIERLAPALAAGNVAVVKVSEKSPITVKIVGDALLAANAPAGIVSLLQGFAEVAAVIAGHPSIHAVTAAGSTETMEALLKASAGQFKKLQFSGGAKNPLIILGDTDYKSLLPEILSSFLVGQGQLCWNTSRIFVLESFAKDFLKEMENFISSLCPLQNPRGSELWTPLISEAATSSLETKIQVGVHEHGKVIIGGQRAELGGFFYKPTVMVDLANCSVLQQDELHGPLLLVTPVKYQHEALKWANTSYLAHSGVIWGPIEKTAKVATQLECAHIWINSWLNGEVTTIFGQKQSSFGNLDISWSGSFYSDVKKLAGAF